MSAKQVLVMKKFPKGLRIGKYVAQGSHASLGALLSLASVNADGTKLEISLSDPFVKEWLVGSFRKITLYVDTEEQLKELHQQALSAGLPTAIIVDSGLTEFNGVPTVTAVGIGPAEDSAIDVLTRHLSLF